MVAKSVVFVLAAMLATTGLATRMSPAPAGLPPCQQCRASPNDCDITAPCSSIPNGQTGQGSFFCGCRPGYRASGSAVGDSSRQWRLNVPGHEHRVWVAPGVACDQLCNDPFGRDICGEVGFANQCRA